MNHTKITIIALLISGTGLFAGEPQAVSIDNGNEFLKEGQKLSFRKEKSYRDYLKVGNTRMGSSEKEWDEDAVTGSGLFLNFGISMPNDFYLNPYFEGGDPSYNTGFNFEVGNHIRFLKLGGGSFGIGLRATWLTASYSKFTYEEDIYRALELSALRLGPQFTIAFNEQMGFDVFYQIGYNFTYQFGAIDNPVLEEDIGWSQIFTGFSNEVGGAFHFKVFTLGMGYRFGKLTMISEVFDGESTDEEYLDDKKYGVNSLRIFLGFKF